jgi:23S rRNA (cytosine1962-C5)-methyltransferase
VVRVIAAEGAALGFGHFGSESIAVKLLTRTDSFDEARFLRTRLSNAVSLRRSLGLFDSERTTGFRLVNAEGDGLPGLVVDLYGATAVMQCQSLGMARFKEAAAEALRELLPREIRAIYSRRKESSKGQDFVSDPEPSRYLYGAREEDTFFENGMRFFADWEEGQKTGFFLDQRENRRLLSELARGKSVLNCFSYTGGFSVAALIGGALEVTSVDSSAPALAGVERHLELNRLSGSHAGVQADCLQYLQKLERPFDIIVLDPPAFIKHRGAIKGGIKGYETINHLALKQLPPGGLLCTFSCSQLLSRADFTDIVERAAARAGRDAQILFELRQAPCHPVNLFHPEGEYLKGLVVAVR